MPYTPQPPRRKTLGKLLSILLACALLLLGGYLTWSGSISPSTEAPAQSFQQAIDGSVQVEGKDSLFDQAPAEPVEQTQRREQVTLSQANGAGILLEVVHADTGATAAGAQVFLVDEASIYVDGMKKEIAGQPFLEKKYAALAQRFGLEFVTDADGSLRLPPASESAYVYVALAPLSALADLKEAKNGRLRIELHPITEIAIRVSQRDGGPVANADLHLVSRERDGQQGRASQITNEEGIARVRIPSPASGIGLEAWDKFGATIRSRFEPYSRARQIKRSTDPKHIHEMVIEAGSLELRLPANLELGGQVVQLQVQRRGNREIAKRSVRSQVTRFDEVPIGEWYIAQLYLPFTEQYFFAEGPGPKRSGELVGMQLRPWQGPPTLSLRLVNAEGHPFAGAPLTMTQKHRRWSHPYSGLRTSRDGVVQIVMKDANQNRAHELTLELDWGGEQYSTVLDLPGEYPPGITDLGDIVLQLPTIVAAGRVLRTDGKPVAGAVVQVQGFRGEGERRRAFSMETATSKPDGSFRVRSRQESVEIRLMARVSGWSQARPKHAVFGQEGLELIMDRAGSFECRVRMDLPIEQGPRFQLQAEDESLLIHELKLEPEPISYGIWRLHAENLAPTSYRLEIQGRSIGIPMESIAPIIIQPGKQTDIEPIDLRGRLERLILKVVDERNQAIDNAHVSVMRDGHGESIHTSADGFGEYSILHWGEAVNVSVEVMGVGYALLENFNRSQVVQLTPLRRRIRVTTDLSFLRDGYQVQLSIRAPRTRDRLGPGWQGKSFRFGADAEDLSLSLPSNTPLELDWAIGKPRGTPTVIGMSDLDPGNVEGATLNITIPADILGGMKAYLEHNR